MAYQAQARIFREKKSCNLHVPLVPFSLCKIFKKVLRADLESWECIIFRSWTCIILGHNWAKIAHLAQEKIVWKFHVIDFCQLLCFIMLQSWKKILRVHSEMKAAIILYHSGPKFPIGSKSGFFGPKGPFPPKGFFFWKISRNFYLKILEIRYTTNYSFRTKSKIKLLNGFTFLSVFLSGGVCTLCKVQFSFTVIVTLFKHSDDVHWNVRTNI